MKNYLGLDWGERKVGVAVADGEMRIAFAHGIWDAEQAVKQIEELVVHNAVTDIIIGTPKNDIHGNIAQGAYKFGEQLAQSLPDIAIHYHDEMFTTKQAKRNLMEAGKKSHKHADDAESARVLLQSWLDTWDD